ncbi:hypothetical protein [Hydrogenophaga sp.]|uniref:hypothetical protein n=1 Tax=Hydrogenophaga sp. TaxID=1904254 RepID=UPI003F72380A
MQAADPFLSFWIPVISLGVAALAVFVGPMVSWRVAKRQSDTSLKVAYKQIVAPMRQKWIDSLRDRVAEIISTSHWFYVSGMHEVAELHEDEDWDRQQNEVDRKLIFLQNQVELMLNPKEEDHRALVTALKEVVAAAVHRAPEHRISAVPLTTLKASARRS